MKDVKLLDISDISVGWFGLIGAILLTLVTLGYGLFMLFGSAVILGPWGVAAMITLMVSVVCILIGAVLAFNAQRKLSKEEREANKDNKGEAKQVATGKEESKPVEQQTAPQNVTTNPQGNVAPKSMTEKKDIPTTATPT